MRTELTPDTATFADGWRLCARSPSKRAVTITVRHVNYKPLSTCRGLSKHNNEIRRTFGCAILPGEGNSCLPRRKRLAFTLYYSII